MNSTIVHVDLWICHYLQLQRKKTTEYLGMEKMLCLLNYLHHLSQSHLQFLMRFIFLSVILSFFLGIGRERRTIVAASWVSSHQMSSMTNLQFHLLFAECSNFSKSIFRKVPILRSWCHVQKINRCFGIFMWLWLNRAMKTRKQCVLCPPSEHHSLCIKGNRKENHKRGIKAAINSHVNFQKEN